MSSIRHPFATAWRALQVVHLKRSSMPAVVGACLIAIAVVYYASFDDYYSALEKAIWALIWAAVTVAVGTVAVWTPLLAFGYWATKRNARYRWHDGAVLETGFGTDAFVTRNPTVTRRIRYDAV